MIWTIAKYTLFEALRNRLIYLALAVLFIAILIYLFVAEITITESRLYSLVIMSSLLRVAVIFVISLFVITSLVREITDKGMATMLSLPLPRYSYFIGKLGGFSLLAGLLISLIFIILLCVAEPVNALVWSLSLFLEMLLVVTLSLFLLLTFQQVTAAFTAVMAFYFLCRSMSAILLINNSSLLQDQSLSHGIISILIESLAFLLPDLDRYTLSEWLVYGSYGANELFLILIQTLIYMSLLSLTALFDLYRLEL